MSATSYPPPPRGVWIMPFKDAQGQPLAAAITSDGRLLATVPVPDPYAVPAVELALWDVLDRADPLPARPRLELIRCDMRPMNAEVARAQGGER